jgi:hypothetical protein
LKIINIYPSNRDYSAFTEFSNSKLLMQRVFDASLKPFSIKHPFIRVKNHLFIISLILALTDFIRIDSKENSFEKFLQREFQKLAS